MARCEYIIVATVRNQGRGGKDRRCGHDAAPGRPYCQQHGKMARRRKDAPR